MISKKLSLVTFSVILFAFLGSLYPTFAFANPKKKAIVVIHGGAGNLTEKSLSKEDQEAYLKSLKETLTLGFEQYKKSESSLAIVEACIRLMENNALFNAGKGAVINAKGDIELDASIMNGEDLKAGAVSGIKTVKNPISLARVVMDKTQHVYISGSGAEELARSQGLEIVNPDYFLTEKRKVQREKILKALQVPTNEGAEKTTPEKHGTVGCVAIDQKQNLAAGTSTGGMMGKHPGRVGDTPIIGAGTYANNATCAVSCTGHGEFFIRYGVAKTVSDLMLYKKQTLIKAANSIIHTTLKPIGGTGGLIALDRKGNYATTFNTSGMFRGVLFDDGTIEVAIFE